PSARPTRRRSETSASTSTRRASGRFRAVAITTRPARTSKRGVVIIRPPLRSRFSGFRDLLRARSEDVLADLAGRHARQLLDDDEVFRKLLTCQPRTLEEAADVGETDGLPGPDHDEGASLFAGLAARHGDDRDVSNRGVGHQDVLDLLRADVLARADDDVLLPS